MQVCWRRARLRLVARPAGPAPMMRTSMGDVEEVWGVILKRDCFMIVDSRSL